MKILQLSCGILTLLIAVSICPQRTMAAQTGRAVFFSAGRYCVYQVDPTRLATITTAKGPALTNFFPVIDRGRSDWSRPVVALVPPGRHEFIAVYDPPPGLDAVALAKLSRVKVKEPFTVPVDPRWLLDATADNGARTDIKQARLTSPCRGQPFVIAAEVDDNSPTVGFINLVPERQPRLPADNPAELWLSRDDWLRDFSTVRVVGGEVNPGCAGDALCAAPREKAEVRQDFWLMTTEVSRAMVRRYHRLQTTEFPPELQGDEVTREANVARFAAASPYRFAGAALLLLPDDFPAVSIEPETARRVCRWLGGRLPTEREWRLAAQGDGAGEFGAPLNAPPALCARGNFLAAALLDPCREWERLKAAWARQLAAQDVPGLGREDYADAGRLGAARRKWLRIAALQPRPDWQVPPESDEGERLRETYCKAHAAEDAGFCAAWRFHRELWEKMRAARTVNALQTDDYRDPLALQAARRKWMNHFNDANFSLTTDFWGPGIDADVRDGLCGCVDRRPGLMARGLLAPNAIGLYDMIGNADELVTQTQDDDAADLLSRPDPSATPRATLGGSWLDGPFTQSFFRPAKAAPRPTLTTGFRCLFEKPYTK